MTRLILILLAALVLEAFGVVLLSHGLKRMGEVNLRGARDVPRVLVQGLSQPTLLLGILLEAVFFGALLYLLSQAEVSLVWPLTSLGFVLTTLTARYLLKEEVSALRWSGVVLIVAGSMLISWSEHQRKRGAAARAEVIQARGEPIPGP